MIKTRQDIFQNHLTTLTAGGLSSMADPSIDKTDPQLRLRLKIQVKMFLLLIYEKHIFYRLSSQTSHKAGKAGHKAGCRCL